MAKRVLTFLILTFLIFGGIKVVKAQRITAKNGFVDLRAHPRSYLLLNGYRLNKNTTLANVKLRFKGKVHEQTRGSDVDKVYSLFIDIPETSHHQWMLTFDVKTSKLMELRYI